MKKKGDSQLYMGIIIIAVGIIMASAMEGLARPLGVGLIILGSIFVVQGAKKKETRKSPKR